MQRKVRQFLVAALAVTAAPVVFGDAIDTVNLTALGSNTVFTIAGTYSVGTPTTTFSSPNAGYLLTFALPTTPFAVDFSDPAGAFGLGTSVTLSGLVFPNSQVVFFESNLGGGLAVCLSQVCNPNSPVSPEWDILGDQLFMGSVDAPSFISGMKTFDPAQSSYTITSPVPEPETLMFGGIGIGLCVLARWRRRLPE